MSIPAKYVFGALLIVAAAFFVFLFIGSAHPPAVISNPTPTPLTASPTPPPVLTAQFGDNVSVDYTLVVENGSVYDTSLESVARAANIYRSGVTYKPLEITIGAGQVIPGFESPIIGMKVGDRKNISIPPKDAYGEYNVSLVQVSARAYPVPRVEAVLVADFLDAFPGFNFSSESTISTGQWNATIVDHTNQTVTIRHDPVIGQTIQTPTWPESVIALNATSITLRRDPVEGKMYVVSDAAGTQRMAKVTGMTDDVLMLDLNHPLAGQALNFSLALVSITRP